MWSKVARDVNCGSLGGVLRREVSRSYVSRAHPTVIPEFPIPTALSKIIEGIQDRKVKRATKWELNASRRVAKGIKDDGPYRNQDETVEVAVNLNLDPRKPGQALRGSLTLPNGTGKKIECVVFTANAELAQKCLEQGAIHAGGEELVDKVLAGEIPLDSFQRTLATQEIMGAVSKQLARLLGPRGLMPSPKLSTVFKSPEELLTSLEQQAKNVTYRTESSGIVHVPVGKGSFSNEQLLENIQSVFQTLQGVKPDFYGKGKKSSKKVGKNVKYFLKAHLSSSQGEGVKVDLRTVDPSSPFFMGDPEAA